MLTWGLITAALAVTAIQASAQDVTVRGWERVRPISMQSSHSIPEAVKHLTWFLGYVSGLAVANHVNMLDKGDRRFDGQLGGRLLRALSGKYHKRRGRPVLQVSPGTDENSFLSQIKKNLMSKLLSEQLWQGLGMPSTTYEPK